MAANGGGPPFIKKEEEQSADSNSNSNYNSVSFSNHHLHHHAHDNIHNDECSNSKFSNNNSSGSRGISIAERRAAKCGFNASNMNAAALSQPPPPLFTIPPSLVSPAALLDSPIMLPNAQAQQSPTTGTFQFPASNYDCSKKLEVLKLSCNGDHAIPMETCSDASEAPREEVQPQPPLSEPNKMFMHENKEFEYPRNLQLQQKVECFDSINDNSASSRDQHQMMMCVKRERGNNSLNNVNPHQKSGGGGGGNNATNNNSSSKNSEDGFYWRKYGQKHVKGSEYPRSYYKCTNTNCPVTKKVERSHDGHVTEIVYKGSHNHPNPQPLLVKREETSDFAQEAADYANLERQPASSNFPNEYPDPFNSYQSLDQYTPPFGVQDPDQERLATSPESISFNEDDHADENGECEIKRRKKDSETSPAVARSTREPKVVVQIESEVDILDDGYRWRKYGQKVVKGNPNPRSYYKCTTPGCPVRKHVERAATDIKSVITTYEGKHNHELPSGKTGNNNANNHSSDQASSAAHANSAAASSAGKLGGDAVRAPGKQAQDHLPMYLDRKPMLNYNGLMHSNNFSPDLNFGPSSLYPLPLPPFQSLPYGPFVMNTTKLYPMMPDYMSSQMNAPVSSSAMPLASTYHYSTTTYAAHHQVPPSTRAQETRAVMPKEEQMRDEDELYDTCLSIPNQGNGSM